MKFSGKVHKYGHNINTDVIIPARYCSSMDFNYLASHCMEDVDPEFSSNVENGDIIVGGENFGCGSSREVAPIAIKSAGISAVIAVSFGRIFFRNAINIGLHVFCSSNAHEIVNNGEVIEVDTLTGRIKSSAEEDVLFEPYPPEVISIVEAGGLTEFVRNKLRKNGPVSS